MELLPKRRLECVIHLMKVNHLNLKPHLFVVFPFSLECTLWNHCILHCCLFTLSKCVLLQWHILLYFLECICFVVSFVLLLNVYCSCTRRFRVWSQRYHLSTWHSIVQLKKVSSNTFINSKNTCSISLWWAIFALLFTLFVTIMKKDKRVLGVEHLDYGCELQLTNCIM
jgi:hypothetical protein